MRLRRGRTRHKHVHESSIMMTDATTNSFNGKRKGELRVDTFSTVLGRNKHLRAGVFTYFPESDSWEWSDEMFEIHGYMRGEVVPSTELILAHVHPEDREFVSELVLRSLRSGEPFSDYRRLVDANGVVRQVIATGCGMHDADGRVARMQGILTELTSTVHLESDNLAREAVQRSVQHRAAIEQLKGAIMARCRLSPDAAFALLSKASQRLNLKVNELAEGLVLSLQDPKDQTFENLIREMRPPLQMLPAED